MSYLTDDSINEVNIIDIDKELIPYRFSLATDQNSVLEMEIRYNAEYDFFTVDLYIDSKLVVSGEKIMYGEILFKDINEKKVPLIIAWDFSSQSERVGFEQLGQNVELVVIDNDFVR